MEFFKIEFYYHGFKQKQKYYETSKAFEKWWSYHKTFYDRLWKGKEFGLVGYKNGEVDRTYGEVPEAKQVNK